MTIRGEIWGESEWSSTGYARPLLLYSSDLNRVGTVYHSLPDSAAEWHA